MKKMGMYLVLFSLTLGICKPNYAFLDLDFSDFDFDLPAAIWGQNTPDSFEKSLENAKKATTEFQKALTTIKNSEGLASSDLLNKKEALDHAWRSLNRSARYERQKTKRSQIQSSRFSVDGQFDDEQTMYLVVAHLPGVSKDKIKIEVQRKNENDTVPAPATLHISTEKISYDKDAIPSNSRTHHNYVLYKDGQKQVLTKEISIEGNKVTATISLPQEVSEDDTNITAEFDEKKEDLIIKVPLKKKAKNSPLRTAIPVTNQNTPSPTVK